VTPEAAGHGDARSGGAGVTFRGALLPPFFEDENGDFEP
jgi:hypothetical protein